MQPYRPPFFVVLRTHKGTYIVMLWGIKKCFPRSHWATFWVFLEVCCWPLFVVTFDENLLLAQQKTIENRINTEQVVITSPCHCIHGNMHNLSDRKLTFTTSKTKTKHIFTKVGLTSEQIKLIWMTHASQTSTSMSALKSHNALTCQTDCFHRCGCWNTLAE